MSYRLEHNEPIQVALSRIACEQLERALGELETDKTGPHEKAFAVRKRCKKVRGLIRLVRPAFGAYKAENAHLRDAARALSGLRDAAAALECYESLIANRPEPAHWEPIHADLIERRDSAASADVHDRLATFRKALLEIKGRAEGWTLDAKGHKAILGGVRRAYADARKAMALAYRERSPETFHEWRKRLKYDRYHTRLLADAWQHASQDRYTPAKDLSDLLGTEHDLSELQLAIGDGPKDLIALIRSTQSDLRLRANEIGKHLYADTPTEHARRVDKILSDWSARSAE